MKLNKANANQIAKKIAWPTYGNHGIETGIVHIGVGGFHRSHQAFLIHRLLQEQGSKDWAICGVGLREADRQMAEVMWRQDGLYTLVTQHPNGLEDYEIIGSIKEYLLAPDDPLAVIDKMSHPSTKIVSLTITEGGYNFNPITGDFNFDHPDVQYELKHPDQPKTVYGFLTAAIRKRRAGGLPPFTVLSCDNIQHNGSMTRKMLLSFVAEQDASLAKWIEREVSFPNSMVDRITPVTPPAVIDFLKEEYQLEDQWPVVCEPFIQWVVEDDFSNGRPPLEAVGVQFVPDVAPYERMKIRLLNAGHSVLGIPGAIHGHPTIDACMRDPVFSVFMRRFMDLEVSPILGTIEGVDVEQYKDSLEERFANPNIKDSVSRICSESAAKLPKFLLPTLRENLKNGGSIKYATFVLAAWCYYSDKGMDASGNPIPIIDTHREKLRLAAQKTESDWTAFLLLPDVFGDLFNDTRFVKEYTRFVQAIYAGKNIRNTMSELLESA